jgi:hypothetical protein
MPTSRGARKHEKVGRIQGIKGSRIQVKNLSVKTLEPLSPVFVLKQGMMVEK